MIWDSREGLRGKWDFLAWVVTWTELDSILLDHHWARGILAGAGTDVRLIWLERIKMSDHDLDIDLCGHFSYPFLLSIHFNCQSKEETVALSLPFGVLQVFE